MAHFIADDLVERARVHLQGYLVGHRPARTKEGGLVTEQGRRLLLQGIHCRGSWRNTSSPTVAFIMALSMGAVGLVTVSETRSIMIISFFPLFRFHHLIDSVSDELFGPDALSSESCARGSG
jgi:hypothetical protein